MQLSLKSCSKADFPVLRPSCFHGWAQNKWCVTQIGLSVATSWVFTSCTSQHTAPQEQHMTRHEAACLKLRLPRRGICGWTPTLLCLPRHWGSCSKNCIKGRAELCRKARVMCRAAKSRKAGLGSFSLAWFHVTWPAQGDTYDNWTESISS